MITIDIPDFGPLELEHLVMDYNGTMAIDGDLIEGVANRLESLSSHLKLHVITADTFGKVKAQMKGVPCSVEVLEPGNQDVAKKEFVEKLGATRVMAVGNGRNDAAMLRTARLGVVVIQEEGAAIASLTAADVATPTINDALDLLLNPLRLVATLR